MPTGLPRTVREVSEIRLAGGATLLFLTAFGLHLAGAPTGATLPLYALCYAVGGWDPTVAGIEALRERRIDVDVLTVVAALAAAAIGQWQDGALLLVIFTTSGALEVLATRRTERSIRALVDLAPEEAELFEADDAPRPVAAADLQPGDRVLVRPGTLIPADGRVAEGTSDVDEAPVTGEPLPVAKAGGDEVFAGTINGVGALEVVVTAAAGESVVARIAKLVREATAAKAPTQLFIERFEQRYAVGVVLVTLGLVTALPSVFGLTFDDALLRSMTFMIVASPCAIVLSTMPALLSAVALAGRNGVLIKGGAVMERLGQVDAVAFDKTGTLTRGRPVVVEVEPLPGWAADGVLAVAAAAESASEHVLAAAVVEAARGRSVAVPAARDVTALPGRGVVARVGGAVVQVGNGRLVGELSEEAARIADAIADRGGTAVLVGVDGEVAGVLGVHDELRHGVRATLGHLAALGIDRTVLLTGDRAAAGRALADAAGIAEAHADLLPEDKVARVADLRRDGTRVLAVGDGINDAPMLATADVSAAMGLGGSDLTLEQAEARPSHRPREQLALAAGCTAADRGDGLGVGLHPVDVDEVGGEGQAGDRTGQVEAEALLLGDPAPAAEGEEHRLGEEAAQPEVGDVPGVEPGLGRSAPGVVPGHRDRGLAEARIGPALVVPVGRRWVDPQFVEERRVVRQHVGVHADGQSHERRGLCAVVVRGPGRPRWLLAVDLHVETVPLGQRPDVEPHFAVQEQAEPEQAGRHHQVGRLPGGDRQRQALLGVRRSAGYPQEVDLHLGVELREGRDERLLPRDLLGCVAGAEADQHLQRPRRAHRVPRGRRGAGRGGGGGAGRRLPVTFPRAGGEQRAGRRRRQARRQRAAHEHTPTDALSHERIDEAAVRK